MSHAVQVTFDCADPAALSRFWAEVLGYRLDDPPKGFVTWDEALEAFGVPEHLRNSASAVHDPTGVGPRLFFQQVPEGKTAKNRVHSTSAPHPGWRPTPGWLRSRTSAPGWSRSAPRGSSDTSPTAG